MTHPRKEFIWAEFAISGNLKANWSQEVVSFAKENAILKTLTTDSVTSRESEEFKEIDTLTGN